MSFKSIVKINFTPPPFSASWLDGRDRRAREYVRLVAADVRLGCTIFGVVGNERERKKKDKNQYVSSRVYVRV